MRISSPVQRLLQIYLLVKYSPRVLENKNKNFNYNSFSSFNLILYLLSLNLFFADALMASLCRYDTEYYYYNISKWLKPLNDVLFWLLKT